jgi:ABC-type transporter Mla subunit MlaD
MGADREAGPMLRDVLQLVESIEAALRQIRRTGGNVATLTAELEQILQEIRGALNAR